MQSFFRLSQPRFSPNLTQKRFFSVHTTLRCTMATTEANGSKPAAKSNLNGKKEVKILMIHGYTQSGPLFRTKTRAMEKLLVKTLTPFSLHPTLIYPTAPNRLRPSDIPGFTPSPNSNPDDVPDMWAWFRRDEASGTYRFFDEGMATIAEAIREASGIDAVCGFSQGGAMTGLIAAALEPGRKVPEGKGGDWARGLREANGGKGVKFAVSYSGFKGMPDDFTWCFEPKIAVPNLHYIGSLDTVVEESRSQELIDRCEDPKVVVHPGGHHVPVSKEWVMPFAAFIKDHAQGEPRAGL